MRLFLFLTIVITLLLAVTPIYTDSDGVEEKIYIELLIEEDEQGRDLRGMGMSMM